MSTTPDESEHSTKVLEGSPRGANPFQSRGMMACREKFPLPSENGTCERVSVVLPERQGQILVLIVLVCFTLLDGGEGETF